MAGAGRWAHTVPFPPQHHRYVFFFANFDLPGLCIFPVDASCPCPISPLSPTPPPSSPEPPGAASSPVWVRTCLFRSKVSLKPFPQKVHKCLFTWLWHLMWRLSMRCRRKPLPHSSQECTVASLQVPVVNWGRERDPVSCIDTAKTTRKKKRPRA